LIYFFLIYFFYKKKMTLDKNKKIYKYQVMSLFFLVVDCLCCSFFFFMTPRHSKFLMSFSFEFVTFYYQYIPILLIILGGTSLFFFATVLWHNYIDIHQPIIFFNFFFCFISMVFCCCFNFYFATLCKMNWLFILATHASKKSIPLLLPYIVNVFNFYLIMIIIIFFIFTYLLFKFFQILIDVQNLKSQYNWYFLYKIFNLLVYLIVPIVLFYIFFYSFTFFFLWFFQQMIVEFELSHFQIVIHNLNSVASGVYNFVFSSIILLFYFILGLNKITIFNLIFSDSEKIKIFKKPRNIFIYFFVLIPVILLVEYTVVVFLFRMSLMVFGVFFNFIFKNNLHFNFINNFCLLLTNGFLHQKDIKITNFVLDEFSLIYMVLGFLTIIIILFSIVSFYYLKSPKKI